MVQDIVVLSQRLDAVAHNFAVERDLSAGFLGSGGKHFALELVSSALRQMLPPRVYRRGWMAVR